MERVQKVAYESSQALEGTRMRLSKNWVIIVPEIATVFAVILGLGCPIALYYLDNCRFYEFISTVRGTEVPPRCMGQSEAERLKLLNDRLTNENQALKRFVADTQNDISIVSAGAASSTALLKATQERLALLASQTAILSVQLDASRTSLKQALNDLGDARAAAVAAQTALAKVTAESHVDDKQFTDLQQQNRDLQIQLDAANTARKRAEDKLAKLQQQLNQARAQAVGVPPEGAGALHSRPSVCVPFFPFCN